MAVRAGLNKSKYWFSATFMYNNTNLLTYVQKEHKNCTYNKNYSKQQLLEWKHSDGRGQAWVIPVAGATVKRYTKQKRLQQPSCLLLTNVMGRWQKHLKCTTSQTSVSVGFIKRPNDSWENWSSQLRQVKDFLRHHWVHISHWLWFIFNNLESINQIY